MNEKIEKVNKVLESVIDKLRKNLDVTEEKVFALSKEIDENSSEEDKEKLVLLKKDVIERKAVYNYYRVRLSSVITECFDSINEYLIVNGGTDDFNVDLNTKDYLNKIDLDELIKGVSSNYIASELVSSLEKFSGSAVAPKEDEVVKSIYEEDDETEQYNIEPSSDENASLLAGSNIEDTEDKEDFQQGKFISGEFAGSSTKEVSREELENMHSAGSSTRQISNEEIDIMHQTGSSVSDEHIHAGSNVSDQADEDEDSGAGSSVKDISEDELNKMHNAGSNTRELSKYEISQMRKAGSDLNMGEFFANSYIRDLSDQEMEEIRNIGSDVVSEFEERYNANSKAKDMTKEDIDKMHSAGSHVTGREIHAYSDVKDFSKEDIDKMKSAGSNHVSEFEERYNANSVSKDIDKEELKKMHNAGSHVTGKEVHAYSDVKDLTEEDIDKMKSAGSNHVSEFEERYNANSKAIDKNDNNSDGIDFDVDDKMFDTQMLDTLISFDD